MILDHATSLTHRCFFRRPTRKIMIPFKCGTPRSRPLRSTSLQPAVRDGRGCRTGAMRTSENSSFPGTSVKVGLEGGRCVCRTPPGAKCQVPSCVRHDPRPYVEVKKLKTFPPCPRTLAKGASRKGRPNSPAFSSSPSENAALPRTLLLQGFAVILTSQLAI